jgi:EXPERA (EXPanded EBP superfamily)
MWEEYGRADSRYFADALSCDYCLVLELLTIVTGSAMLLRLIWLLFKLATLTATTPKRGKSHVAIRAEYEFWNVMLCTCEIYGTFVYVLSEMFGQESHVVPPFGHSLEATFLFWFYYAAMNGVWIVVPAVLLASSFRTLVAGDLSGGGTENE